MSKSVCTAKDSGKIQKTWPQIEHSNWKQCKEINYKRRKGNFANGKEEKIIMSRWNHLGFLDLGNGISIFKEVLYKWEKFRLNLR